MSFIALGVATIRAEERRCSRELWPQFGECQDNKLFRLRRRSRSRQGKQGSRRDSRLGCPAEAKPPYRRLSLLCPKSCAKSPLPACAAQDVSIPQAIGSATRKSPVSCPPSARDTRRAPRCPHPSDAFSGITPSALFRRVHEKRCQLRPGRGRLRSRLYLSDHLPMLQKRKSHRPWSRNTPPSAGQAGIPPWRPHS